MILIGAFCSIWTSYSGICCGISSLHLSLNKPIYASASLIGWKSINGVTCIVSLWEIWLQETLEARAWVINFHSFTLRGELLITVFACVTFIQFASVTSRPQVSDTKSYQRCYRVTTNGLSDSWTLTLNSMGVAPKTFLCSSKQEAGKVKILICFCVQFLPWTIV